MVDPAGISKQMSGTERRDHKKRAQVMGSQYVIGMVSLISGKTWVFNKR